MAAVTTSPPPTAVSPTSNYQDSRQSDDAPRSPIRVPNLNLANGPQLRQAPVSPVRVNFQDENWAQPSNVDIEHAQRQASQLELADRTRHPLPSPPDAAPPPPPHGFSAEFEFEDSQDFYDGTQGTPRADRTLALPLDTSFARQPQPTVSSPTRSPNAVSNLSPTYTASHERYEHNKISPTDRVRNQDQFRNSRESDETASTNPQQTSIESSATTSASSLSGINENAEVRTIGDSPESSIIEGNLPGTQSVPQFQYHHQKDFPPRVSSVPNEDSRSYSTPDLAESASTLGRHLTPSSSNLRRTSMPRPQSSYSIYSDGRGRSPGLMPGGSQARKSPDVRLSTYAELLNAPYPQQGPAPLTPDNSNLRTVIGNNASLLSTQKTLDMYRANVKKTNDLSIQYSFAVFLISTAQEQGLDVSDPKMRKNSPKPQKGRDSPTAEGSVSTPYELVREARQILQRLSSAGYPFAQYYLADGYASGLFNKGKEDYNSAFPLFVLAAKHGHAESGYRTALCYEFGWGCRKDPAKAVQFLRSAASKRHPGAMTRLGKACLSGDLGEKRYREGIKWMKLASEAADMQYNSAPYQLGCLYENGYGADIFKDDNHAAELFTQAADLGHPEANYRLGDAYEHGLLNCPRDPALSVHFYTGAAERGHAGAMMGLCAWYMVGAPPILEKDEEEAYEWARRSADLGFVKAQYAVGYFTEMGIGCRRDALEANVWYVKAADSGDERARQRLAIIQAAVSGQGTPMEVAPPRNGKIQKGNKDDKDCVVM